MCTVGCPTPILYHTRTAKVKSFLFLVGYNDC
nr:MAG TPA: hypothetical protein [Caudoviricetes sp.]